MRMMLKGMQYCLLIILSTLPGYTQTITWLGTLGGLRSFASSASADGTVVIGTIVKNDGTYQAFRWTMKDGMQSLYEIDTNLRSARIISADGSTIIGHLYGGGLFRWRASTGIQNIGIMSGYPLDSCLYGVSDVSEDGSIIIGYIRLPNYSSVGFIWDSDKGFKQFDSLTGYGFQTSLNDISSDGSTVIGSGNSQSSSRNRAFHWTTSEGFIDSFQELPELNKVTTVAYKMSDDGSIIVGTYDKDDDYTGPKIFRWIKGNKIQIIENPPDYDNYTQIYTISGNGKIIIGTATSNVYNTYFFRWTEEKGFENINKMYAHLLKKNYDFYYINSISYDGRYIIGTCTNRYVTPLLHEAFILDTQGTPSSSTDVNEKSTISLYPITPNPINGISTIHFSTPEQTHATLSIVDILGRKVATLADQEFESGKHSQTFDASTLSGGLYYCQLKIGETIKSQKMIIMK